MNKKFNNLKKKVVALTMSSVMTLSAISISFADSARVVTLGANLNDSQKEQMLKYFGVNENEVVLLEVNNQEERKYLEGVASNEQLGNVTISCSFVEPTKKGNGINVKTANLTWVTSSMIATTLSTAGIENANVIAAAPFAVSGTGALTGVMKAFEDATGEALPEDKKELATEELVTTGDLGDEIGQDKATGVINDIKTEIIKNNTSDTIQIAETINNVTNNYNITLTDEQFKKIEDLMIKVSEQKYDYDKVKDTLENVSDNVEQNLSDLGEELNNSGFFESIGDAIGDFFEGISNWFSGLFGNDKDLGILENTNDELLGEDAQIDATDKEAITLPSSDEVEGFFAKIWNWFTGLFSGDSSDTTTEPPTSDDTNTDSSTDSTEETLNDSENNIEDNTTTDSNESSEDSSLETETPSEDTTTEEDAQSTDETTNDSAPADDANSTVETPEAESTN